jgi:hypothetical protein
MSRLRIEFRQNRLNFVLGLGHVAVK